METTWTTPGIVGSVSADDPLLTLVDDYTTDVIVIVQYCIISSIVNIFGIVCNIVNITVFIKQGFREVINISLLGLAVSDLCGLLMLQWINIGFCPLFKTSHISFILADVVYVTGVWPRMAFNRVTAWITAYITFERCICIALPLKVRAIITPVKAIMIIIAIFIMGIGSVAPSYYSNRLVWKFVAQRNRTLYGLGFTRDRYMVDSIMFAISNVSLPLMAFSIVVLCTIILVVKLYSKAKWRNTSSRNADHITNKDKKIAKLVSIISMFFIVCFFPNAMAFWVMIFEPELSIHGKYRNVTIMMGIPVCLLESLNATINIFLYMKMSSKFRCTFKQTFSCTFYKKLD